MNFIVMGAGYVGICTAINLALRTDSIITVYDPDSSKISKFAEGKSPFFEQDLEKELEKLTSNGQIRFFSTGDLKNSEKLFDASFICVGTPALSNGSTNLTYVNEALNTSCSRLKTNGKIFIRSSCPPHSIKDIEITLDTISKRDIDLFFYPEFLREGTAIADMKNPDRVIIGGSKKLNQDWIGYLAPLRTPYLLTTAYEASLIKYANNSLLGTLITFANQIAKLAEMSEHGADLDMVMKGVLLDRRWQIDGKLPSITTYLQPGIGYGGSCLPKDIKALSAIHPNTSEVDFFRVIDILNENRIHDFTNYLKKVIENIENKKVLIVGASFKEGTDDLRNSPGIRLSEVLSKFCEVKIVDNLVKNIESYEIGIEIISLENLIHKDYQPDVIILTHADKAFNDKVLSSVDNCQYVVKARNQKISTLKNAKNLYLGGITK